MSIPSRTLYGLVALAALVITFFSWQNYQSQEIVIEWSTASELDAAGFNIYRSDGEDGPYKIINPQLIPSSADPLTGASYEFTDENVDAGQIYFYRLEEVELTGVTTDLGTTSSATSNLPLYLTIVAALLSLAAGVGALFSGSQTPDSFDD